MHVPKSNTLDEYRTRAVSARRERLTARILGYSEGFGDSAKEVKADRPRKSRTKNLWGSEGVRVQK